MRSKSFDKNADMDAMEKDMLCLKYGREPIPIWGNHFTNMRNETQRTKIILP